MHTPRSLLNWFTHLHVIRLPFHRRLLHPKTRRHIFGLLLGVILMLVGSCLSQNYHVSFLPHFVWDAIAYGIHGVGVIPIALHLDPLWRTLLAIE